jgi:hypothetical protein
MTPIEGHVQAAKEAAVGKKLDPPRRLRIFLNGPLIERARSNLDAAEAQLLDLAPPNDIFGQMPSLLRHVQRHLPATDPGRQEFERIARSVGMNDPNHPSRQNGGDQDLDSEKAIERQRGTIVTTVRAEALREHEQPQHRSPRCRRSWHR